MPQQWLPAAAVLLAHMGLALAFLQQAIAQAVVQAFFQVLWVLSLWAPVHSVGQAHTQPKGWITAVATLVCPRVRHGSPLIIRVVT